MNSSMFNSSLRLVIFKVILNKIIATASLSKPSPKIIEWTFGKDFFLITVRTETVSVAVRVADKSKRFVPLSNSIFKNS